MPEANLWNSLDVAKLLVAILTPLVVALVGYWISMQLRRNEQDLEKEREERKREYEEQKEEEREAREEQRREIERRYTPHIELEIDCQFFGPREDRFLVEFLILATNRGYVVHQFPSIQLRLRGIKEEMFQYWDGREPRAYFPHKIFQAELVPTDWNFIYVEPGVAHQITFPTIVSADFSYILAHVEFAYDKDRYWPHNTEKVFAVPNGN